MKVCVHVAGNGGVAFYRAHQPYNYAMKHGLDAYIFDNKKHDGSRLAKEHLVSDVLVYQCAWSEAVLTAARLAKKGSNKKIVLEYDDDFFNVDPFNEKYNVFGIKEVEIGYSKPEQIAAMEAERHKYPWVQSRKKGNEIIYTMWKQGESDFDINANLKKRESTIALMNEADLITVTTKELGKTLRKLAPKTKIVVLPNLIDFDRWLPMEPNDSDFIRIGWQGGGAHFRDIYEIGPAIKEIAKKYKNVKFCFMGVQYPSLFSGLKGIIEWAPWHGDVSTYPLVAREMKLDIGLCPLKDTKFNRNKSELKWLEYSALKIPAIVSPIVYGNVVEHNKTGLIARTCEDWYNYMALLINDEVKRKCLAEKAYLRVKNNHGVDKSVLWKYALEDLFKPKLKLAA